MIKYGDLPLACLTAALGTITDWWECARDKTPLGPAPAVLDKEETEDDDEAISLQRKRKRKTPAHQPEDIKGLFTKLHLVENVEFRFRAPVNASSQKGSTSDVPPPSTSTSVAASGAPASPPAPIEQEGDVHYPRSPDQGNIENAFLAPIQNSNGKCGITFSVSNVSHLLSKLLGVSNYLKSLTSDKDWRNMDGLFMECLINNNIHFAPRVPFHPSLFPLHFLTNILINSYLLTLQANLLTS